MGENLNEVNKVFETTNYDMFSRIKGNRLIDESNLRKIKYSIKEKNLDIPIIINEKGQIIDGQHRLEVWKDLRLPVKFIVNEGYSLEDVQRANMTGKQWSINDKLNLYIAQDLKSYENILEIKDKYKIPVMSILNIYAKASGIPLSEMKYLFEHGRFNSSAQEYVDVFIKQLHDFSDYVNIRKNSFITAFLELSFIKEPFKYDHFIMLNKIPKYGRALMHVVTKGQYLDILCNNIYSLGLTKNKICYNYATGKFHM